MWRAPMRKPPLWLAAAAVASAWMAVYSVGRWILQFATGPVHEDIRLTYVAAEAGIQYGWSTIYEQSVLRELSASFPGDARYIDSVMTYVNPPLLAWLFAPLTVFSEPIAYAVWTVISLAALIFAWHIAAPYAGLAKVTLLLVVIGLWPVLLSFFFGQPIILVVALLAAAWWLTAHERPLAAGAALAVATFLKPQDVVLLPVVLLVSGRYRVVAAWALGCAALGAATALNLGSAGLTSWWHAIRDGQASPTHLEYTLAHVFGLGPLTYALWAVQGAAAVYVAWARKLETEIVFAAGILGSATIAFHFHQADYSCLVLGAWLVLRTAPPTWHRLWMLPGILAMQAMIYLVVVPQLIWDATWLAMLVAGTFAQARSASRTAWPIPVRP
jgi:hypothetical protein